MKVRQKQPDKTKEQHKVKFVWCAEDKEKRREDYIGNMLNNIKQKILKYKYKKAKNIYIIGCWAHWGILTAKYSGQMDKDGNPLTIHFTDHNGLKEEYYIAPWYTETTGIVIGYSFNEKQAKSIVERIINNKW